MTPAQDASLTAQVAIKMEQENGARRRWAVSNAATQPPRAIKIELIESSESRTDPTAQGSTRQAAACTTQSAGRRQSHSAKIDGYYIPDMPLFQLGHPASALERGVVQIVSYTHKVYEAIRVNFACLDCRQNNRLCLIIVRGGGYQCVACAMPGPRAHRPPCGLRKVLPHLQAAFAGERTSAMAIDAAIAASVKIVKVSGILTRYSETIRHDRQSQARELALLRPEGTPTVDLMDALLVRAWNDGVRRLPGAAGRALNERLQQEMVTTSHVPDSPAYQSPDERSLIGISPLADPDSLETVGRPVTYGRVMTSDERRVQSTVLAYNRMQSSIGNWVTTQPPFDAHSPPQIESLDKRHEPRCDLKDLFPPHLRYPDRLTGPDLYRDARLTAASMTFQAELDREDQERREIVRLCAGSEVSASETAIEADAVQDLVRRPPKPTLHWIQYRGAFENIPSPAFSPDFSAFAHDKGSPPREHEQVPVFFSERDNLFAVQPPTNVAPPNAPLPVSVPPTFLTTIFQAPPASANASQRGASLNAADRQALKLPALEDCPPRQPPEQRRLWQPEQWAVPVRQGHARRDELHRLAQSHPLPTHRAVPLSLHQSQQQQIGPSETTRQPLRLLTNDAHAAPLRQVDSAASTGQLTPSELGIEEALVVGQFLAQVRAENGSAPAASSQARPRLKPAPSSVQATASSPAPAQQPASTPCNVESGTRVVAAGPPFKARFYPSATNVVDFPPPMFKSVPQKSTANVSTSKNATPIGPWRPLESPIDTRMTLEEVVKLANAPPPRPPPLPYMENPMLNGRKATEAERIAYGKYVVEEERQIRANVVAQCEHQARNASLVSRYLDAVALEKEAAARSLLDLGPQPADSAAGDASARVPGTAAAGTSRAGPGEHPSARATGNAAPPKSQCEVRDEEPKSTSSSSSFSRKNHRNLSIAIGNNSIGRRLPSQAQASIQPQPSIQQQQQQLVSASMRSNDNQTARIAQTSVAVYGREPKIIGRSVSGAKRAAPVTPAPETEPAAALNCSGGAASSKSGGRAEAKGHKAKRVAK